MLGILHGHPSINDCMSDPVFAKFMRQFMDQEATPVLDPIEGIDLKKYKDSLEERFANPNIKDSVSRICCESSAKLPKFLIPTIQDNLASGGSIDRSTLILAAWCFYSDKEMNEKNEPLEIIDTQKDKLHQAAAASKNDLLEFLRLQDIFGNLIDNKRFTDRYKEMITLVYEREDIRGIMKEMI